jgi:hypothetical protein
LSQTVIVEKVNNLSQFFRKGAHNCMEVCPEGEVFGLFGLRRKCPACFIGRLMIRVVVSRCSFGAVMMLLEIEQLPPDLDCGKVQKVSDGLQFHLGQGPMQSDEAVLENIISRLPTPEARIAPKHPPGESQEPFARVI